MLIKDLLKASMLESFTDISVSKLGISDMVNRADAAIDGTEAGRAVDSFVGVPHDARSMGIEFGVMLSGRLEDAYSNNPSDRGKEIRQQIEKAFEPVKSYLRQKFGDSITLYRGQPDIENGKTERGTLSWTSDPRVAAAFVGVKPWEMKLKPISDQEIKDALAKYHATGQLKWRNGKTYVRTETPTEDPNLDEFYYDILDRDGDILTDGDDLEHELKSYQEYYLDLIRKRDDKIKLILKAKIPIDDIIWITDRAGQSEFILHNRPEARGYVGPTGKLIK
jgi:hypothetical protein